MTKKREKFLIDLMDDTDSDNSGSIKPKAWKRLRKGNARHEANAEVCFDDNFVDDEDPTRVNWDPFAFGSMFWCGDNPDADELRWQAKIREEKLDEGSILYFEEEEEILKEMEREREHFELQQLKDRSPATKPDPPTKCWTNALPT